MEPITIVIADDHALVRSGLRQLLELEPDMTVVGEAGDADAALELARARGPKALLLDLTMPGTPSLDAIPGFVSLSPAPAVVVLTAHDEHEFAREALAAGASAYVLKDAAETHIVEAIRAAVAGRPYLDPAMGARLAAASLAPRPAPGLPAGELAVGSTFAGHRVDGVAGRGGMGVVYRATDLTLDRRVALKLIAPSLAADPVFRARFELECRLAAAIDHPHAVEPFRAGEERGQLYVTMRFVEGTDLRELLRSIGRLEPLRAATIVAEVAGALDEAHRHGLVHRDVKPANVLIASQEGVERAYLTDFGVCRQRTVASELTGTGLAIGSADYMAPEQAQGADIDARADVYSLGCVFFQTLTGAVPYDRDSDLEKLWAHAHEAAAGAAGHPARPPGGARRRPRPLDGQGPGRPPADRRCAWTRGARRCLARVSRGGPVSGLPRMRESRLALPLLVALPVPITVALAVTGRPVYPEDACYYGAPRASLLATDHYLGLMTPLGMFAIAAAAAVGLPVRGRWRIVAPALFVWAVVSLIWTDAAHAVLVYGAYVTIFGLFLAVPIMVFVGVAGREASWVRAIGWFEVLYLLPVLLGLAGLLAQPKCFAGNPPAPIPR